MCLNRVDELLCNSHSILNLGFLRNGDGAILVGRVGGSKSVLNGGGRTLAQDDLGLLGRNVERHVGRKWGKDV